MYTLYLICLQNISHYPIDHSFLGQLQSCPVTPEDSLHLGGTKVGMVPMHVTEGTIHITDNPWVDRVVAKFPKSEIPPSCLDLTGCLFTLVVLPVNFDGWRVLPSHHGSGRSERDHTDIALDSGHVHRCRANHDLS